MRARMRAPPFQRLMHRLALAATFALLLVPTIGRLAQAGQGEVLRDAWGAMCTAAGLSYEEAPVAQAHHGHRHAQPMPSAPAMPGMPHHGAGDCDYSPLLQAMVSPKAPSRLPVAGVPPVAPTAVDAAAPPRFRHPNGLGSRGPPSFS